MTVVDSIARVRQAVGLIRTEGKTVGLVPTMGALHEGHFYLIRQCRDECDYVVVSIFVNPAQFGPGEDLANYPRPLEVDCEACSRLKADLVFAPGVKEMYYNANLTWVNVDKLTEHLCGAERPGHFRGVCTVVAKLFNIVTPDRAYFGQKDAQQLAVVRRMTSDLNLPVQIVSCPTVRHADGLAISSRNQYLDRVQRTQATCLFKALIHARELVARGHRDAATIVSQMSAIITAQDQAEIDYISVVDTDLLQPVNTIDTEALIALAVKIGPARLIDNLVVKAN